MSMSRTAGGAIAGLVVSGLLVALPATTSTAATSTAATSTAATSTKAAATDCPTALPTAQAVDGLSGTGYTVEKGNTADPFTAKVLGRITDGIAPGIDMIMAELDSPALQRAGGVWSGMSGSPVYTSDGELIGAVSYTLTSTTKIAGITPAEDMLALLNDPSNARRAAVEAKKQVAISGDKADRIARTGKASKALAAKGFNRLSTPITATGLVKKNSGKFLKTIAQDSGAAVRVGTGSGASANAKAAPGEIFAGSNYVAALSYGDVSIYGLGTATYVCDDTAVAFGHPLLSAGRSDYSAHSAQSLFVQPDPTFGPFKVGNPGGVAGTVTWDGTVGLRSTLGQAPAHQFPITTSLVNDQGKKVTGKTVGVYQSWAADIAASHLQAAVAKANGAQSAGSAAVKITVKGTRANGKKFKITHEDHFASTYDISYVTADSLYFLLSPLAGQPFEELDITSVDVSGSVSTVVKEYRVSKLQVKEKGKWVALKDETTVAAGASIPLRAVLNGYRNSDSITVPLTVTVPAGTSGSTGTLSIADGLSAGYEEEYQEPSSIEELLKQLNDTPSGDTLVSKVTVETEDGTVGIERTEEVGAAVASYSKQVAVSVS